MGKAATFIMDILEDSFKTSLLHILKSPLGAWTTIPPGWKWFSAINTLGEVQLLQSSAKGHKQYKKIGRSKLVHSKG